MVGIVVAKFFAKLKFVLLPLPKFLPILLKSGGTMLLMIWVYTTVGLAIRSRFCSSFVGPRKRPFGCR